MAPWTHRGRRELVQESESEQEENSEEDYAQSEESKQEEDVDELRRMVMTAVVTMMRVRVEMIWKLAPVIQFMLDLSIPSQYTILRHHDRFRRLNYSNDPRFHTLFQKAVFQNLYKPSRAFVEYK
uniref:Uncharacterized protein n=1 Tax=Oryza sativa subsp. japonica TaxID=39947 RepID=Q2QWA5_ORYSJ|nr:hypothetical protein LOC_Os12g10020 [Oryza sativa Japonica Group]